MAPKRKPTGNASRKSGVSKTAQRLVYAKTGKLSKTNLQTLFSDPDLWDALNSIQQKAALKDLQIADLFGAGHPQEEASGKYVNYFTEANPLATRVSPNRDTGTDQVEQANEVYFDLTKHLERFRDHLTNGHFDPKWMKISQETTLQRARGDYDDFWNLSPETTLSEESARRVAEVKAKRHERIAKGLE